MNLPIRIAATLPLVCLLFQASTAFAASSVAFEGSPTLVTSGDASVAWPAVEPRVVNYQDCIEDDSLRFPVSATPAPAEGETLEVWVGEGATDCTMRSNRVGATAQCWQVGTITPLASTSFQVDIRVQDLLSQFGQPTKDSSGSSPRGDASSCGILSAGLQMLTVYAFTVASGQGVGTAASTTVRAETVSADTMAVGITPEDGMARLTMLDAPDPSIVSYEVYCDARPAAAASTDGGSASCAGSVLATSGHGPYGPTQRYKGPPANSYVCATIPATQVQGEVQGLVNGTTYAIAIAAVDIYGNRGDVSDVTCVTPIAGAPATSSGSASCAIGPASRGAGPFVLVLGFAALAIARIRRKRITH